MPVVQTSRQNPIHRYGSRYSEIALLEQSQRDTFRDLQTQCAPQTASRRSRRRTDERVMSPINFFPAMWLAIAAVSAYDTYLTVKFCEQLPQLELNPVGRWLLDLDAGEPALLIGAKFMGSTLVMGILFVLQQRHRRIGMMVTTIITGLQIALLGYLTI